MKTDKHDKIHLWFHDPKNVELFIRFMRDHVQAWEFTADLDSVVDDAFDERFSSNYKDKLDAIETFDFIEKNIEVPLFRGKVGAHTNTIDNIIKLLVQGPGVRYRLGLNQAQINANIKRYDTRNLQFKLMVLSEYKPNLDRISNFLGQIKLYQIRLGEFKRLHDIISPVLVTLDQDRTYDSMIEEQHITIFRLEYDDYKERVVTPKALLMQYSPQPAEPSQEKLTE